MALEERDRLVYDFVCLIGFITIEAAAELFYKRNALNEINVKRYEIARRRLAKLVQYNYLKKITVNERNKKLFVLKENKYSERNKHKFTESDFVILNYLIKLNDIGAVIQYMSVEQTFKSESIVDDDVRVDLIVIFKFNSRIYKHAVEVMTRNGYISVDKYTLGITRAMMKDTLIDFNQLKFRTAEKKLEYIKEYTDTKFKIVLVQNTNKVYDKKNKYGTEICHLRLNLDKFEKVINI